MHKQKLAGTITFSGVQIFLVIAISILFFLSLESANALEVKVIVPEELQSTLSEGEPVSLTLTISDYDDKCNLSFETHLARDGINPFYVLPDLNERVDKKSFEIAAPQQKEIKVQIVGRAPSSNEIKKEKNVSGLKIVKYNLGPYKYFEIKQVDTDGSPPGHEVFHIDNISMQDIKEFNEKLEKIKWKELMELKKFTKDLFFEKGLVDEASILTDELAKIPEPKDFIEIILLSCIVVGIVSGFFFFVIGYRRGKKKGGRKND